MAELTGNELELSDLHSIIENNSAWRWTISEAFELLTANGVSFYEKLPPRERTSWSVHLAIGNTDDKLSSREWAEFIKDVDTQVASIATQAMRWFSAPDDPWQSACWMLMFKNEQRLLAAQRTVIKLRRQYRQDSVAWTLGEAVFI